MNDTDKISVLKGALKQLCDEINSLLSHFKAQVSLEIEQGGVASEVVARQHTIAYNSIMVEWNLIRTLYGLLLSNTNLPVSTRSVFKPIEELLLILSTGQKNFKDYELVFPHQLTSLVSSIKTAVRKHINESIPLGSRNEDWLRSSKSLNKFETKNTSAVLISTQNVRVAARKFEEILIVDSISGAVPSSHKKKSIANTISSLENRNKDTNNLENPNLNNSESRPFSTKRSSAIFLDSALIAKNITNDSAAECQVSSNLGPESLLTSNISAEQTTGTPSQSQFKSSVSIGTLSLVGVENENISDNHNCSDDDDADVQKHNHADEQTTNLLAGNFSLSILNDLADSGDDDENEYFTPIPKVKVSRQSDASSRTVLKPKAKAFKTPENSPTRFSLIDEVVPGDVEYKAACEMINPDHKNEYLVENTATGHSVMRSNSNVLASTPTRAMRVSAIKPIEARIIDGSSNSSLEDKVESNENLVDSLNQSSCELYSSEFLNNSEGNMEQIISAVVCAKARSKSDDIEDSSLDHTFLLSKRSSYANSNISIAPTENKSTKLDLSCLNNLDLSLNQLSLSTKTMAIVSNGCDNFQCTKLPGKSNAFKSDLSSLSIASLVISSPIIIDSTSLSESNRMSLGEELLQEMESILYPAVEKIVSPKLLKKVDDNTQSQLYCDSNPSTPVTYRVKKILIKDLKQFPQKSLHASDSKHIESQTFHSDSECIKPSFKKVPTESKFISVSELRKFNRKSSFTQILMIPLNAMFNTTMLDLNQPQRLGRNNSTNHSSFTTFSSLVVSRNHLDIFERDGMAFIKDVGSNSGTFRNNVRLSQPGETSLEVEITTGDYIQLGKDFLEDMKSMDAFGRITSKKRCVRFQIIIIQAGQTALDAAQSQSIPIENCVEKFGEIIKTSDSESQNTEESKLHEKNGSETLIANQAINIEGSSSAMPKNLVIAIPPPPSMKIKALPDLPIKSPVAMKQQYIIAYTISGGRMLKLQMSNFTGSPVLEANLKNWEDKSRVTVQDLKDINLSYDICLENKTGIKNQTRPRNFTDSAVWQVVSCLGTNHGSLSFVSDMKLELNPAEKTLDDSAIAMTGDFKEQRFICVKKWPQTREQKLFGEAKGRQLSKKTLRESYWMVTFEFQEIECNQLVTASFFLSCLLSV